MTDLLEGTSVVDVHCHGWRSDEVAAAPQRGFLDRITMLGMCLMSSGLEDERHTRDPRAHHRHARRSPSRWPTGWPPCSAASRRATAWPRPARRALADHRAYLRRLWADAGVTDLIMDDGYPLPRIDGRALGAEVGLPVHRVCRIEPVITDVRDAAGTYAELEDAFTPGSRRRWPPGRSRSSR